MDEKPTSKTGEDIMSVLLQHEVRDSSANTAAKSIPGHENNSDSSDDEMKQFDNVNNEGKIISFVFFFLG